MSAPMVDRKMMVISSDGHATARMEDYTEYLDPAFRDEFREFCVEYSKHGSHTHEEPALRGRLDPYVVDEWVEDMLRPGRTDGNWNPERRLRELESEGVVAEVLFPDFGLPFEDRREGRAEPGADPDPSDRGPVPPRRRQQATERSDHLLTRSHGKPRRRIVQGLRPPGDARSRRPSATM